MSCSPAFQRVKFSEVRQECSEHRRFGVGCSEEVEHEDHTTKDARALLQTAQDMHGERHGLQTFTPGTHVPLEAAAEHIGIRPGSRRYDTAIEELEYEAAN
jgi:hypothetical protein